MDQIIQQFHFLRPQWLYALVPLLLLWFMIRRIAKTRSGWQSVLAKHLYQHVIIEGQQGSNGNPLWLLAIAWVIATFALAGPSWEKLPQPVYQLNAGKVVVLDMSMSMRATDISPDRLTRAKYKAIDLIQQTSEGEIGLVAYAGDAFTISPLSSDAQNLTTLLPSLSPEIMPVAGSDPYSGLKMAAELLENAGFVEGDIYWLTDGVEMAQVAELRTLLAQMPYRLSVLAVGSEDGAPIQLLNGDFLKDRTGAIVIPKLDSAMLEGLSRSTGGAFSMITSDDTDIARLTDLNLNQRQSKDPQESKDKFGDKFKEAGPFFVLVLIPIALIGFRRGYLFSVLVLSGSMLLTPPPVKASPWQDLWKTEDQQAAQAYNQGNLEDAAQQFEDPMWKGVAHYKNGHYEEALAAFSQVEGVDATYNRANALAKLGQLDEAIAAYEQVLEAQSEHLDAQTNKHLVEQLKAQQEQQDQEQNQQQQDGDEQQQSQQNNQQQDNQQQDNPQQGQQQSEQSEPSQQQEDQQAQEEQQNGQPDSDTQTQPPPQQQKPENQGEGESESQQIEAQQQETELTDEQKEQLQRMQNLLNKVPDDPAFLLKRKMMLENQMRKRQTMPSNNQRSW